MSYEEIPPDVIVPQDTPVPKCLDTVIALYDFPGSLPLHLRLDLGDTVYVLNKSESGWWDGVVLNNGEMARGWFPQNYVRLVNYVQPVLDKLKLNKEIDLITAANTAANVLIPLFTTLLQKLLLDLGKSLGTNTRKNSVVLFALLEEAEKKPAVEQHQPSLGLTVLSGTDMPPVKFISVEEAERLAGEIKNTEGKNLVWVTRPTSTGHIAFYLEQLEAYCDTLPMVPLVPRVDMAEHGNLDFPLAEALHSNPVVQRADYQPVDMKDFEKRGSNALLMLHLSSLQLYHHFLQPFFAIPHLFYAQTTDIALWLRLRDNFCYLLDLTWKALKDHIKQLFSVHLAQLTKIVMVVFACARLVQDDYIGTANEHRMRRKLRKVSGAFAQMYINGLLHLSMMHHSRSLLHAALFSLGIRDLNRLTSAAQDLDDEDISAYLNQIHHETEVFRSGMCSLIGVFIETSKNKKVSYKDYDLSDNSDTEGEDRTDLLPQVFPRFITDEFNGGNWCNPFFTETKPYLNVSGEHLKNKYHQKCIIDLAAADRLRHFATDIAKVLRDCLVYLEPQNQKKYYNEALVMERNEQVLRLVYKYLHHLLEMLDLLELLDFTVFCLVKRYSVTDKEQNSLAFDYPAVLEFFQQKQKFHTLVAKVIMYTQLLTLEDPDVFVAMKDEESVLYGREAMKDPLQKAAAVLSNVLAEQNLMKAKNAIVIDQERVLADLLLEGIEFTCTIVSTVQQLVDERETILNHAIRVMYDDFNVELLVIERNNTAAADRADDGAQYYSGKTKDLNVPWYLEGDEEYDLLLDLKGNIKGGTKEALVAHLTHHMNVDEPFNRVFLVSFPTILHIGELIQLLMNRFNMDAPEGLSYEEYLTWKTEHQGKVRIRALDVMRLLTNEYWHEAYRNEVVLQRWLAFTKLPAVRQYSQAAILRERIERLLAGESIKQPHQPELPPGKPPASLLKGFTLKKMKLHDIDYVELARQITLREFLLFCKIDKLACIHKVWGTKSGVDVSVADISNFIKTSNQLTFFVSYMILRKEDTRKRVRVIRYFVQVADKCRQYKNYSLMTAIISALYSLPIHRLTKTWALVSPDILGTLSSMNKLMNLSRNFNEYRDMLHVIDKEPCVPFFGVYLSDLTFIFHGNPQFLLNRNRMVNFAKRAKTVDIVDGIDRFQQVGYNFHLVLEIQKFLDLWLEQCPPIEEQYQLSLQLEPKNDKGSTSEKSVLSHSGPKGRQLHLNVLGMKQ